MVSPLGIGCRVSPGSPVSCGARYGVNRLGVEPNRKPNPDVANLYQMWVAPNYRGLSAGQMLLESVIAWASAANMCYLVLNVTCGDSPALRLYVRAGFQAVGEPEPLRPGSELLAQPMRLALRMGV